MMPAARRCARCGKPKGCFAFTLVRDGKPERGYYHPACFTKAKASCGLNADSTAKNGSFALGKTVS